VCGIAYLQAVVRGRGGSDCWFIYI
jgi:hypothetical protein